MPARAMVFDFNGTLSHDEPILCEIFIALMAERGRPLSAQEYYDELVGLSDEEAVRRRLERARGRAGGRALCGLARADRRLLRGRASRDRAGARRRRPRSARARH